VGAQHEHRWPPQPGIQVATQTVLHNDAHPSRLTVPLVQP
jgi:hypothetical protein